MPKYRILYQPVEFHFSIPLKELNHQDKTIVYNKILDFPQMFIHDIELIKSRILEQILKNTYIKDKPEREILNFIEKFLEAEVVSWFSYAQDILNGDEMPVRQLKACR